MEQDIVQSNVKNFYQGSNNQNFDHEQMNDILAKEAII